MGNRLYTAAVVAFWLATMSWLLTNRILPPFFGGDPPPTSLAYQLRPVAWKVELDGVPCGTAVLQATKGISGVREVHSVLKLSRMPAPTNAPLWLKPVLSSLKNLSLEMRTDTTFDSLGSLSSFRTKLYLDQLKNPVQITGQIDRGILTVKVRAVGIVHEVKKKWPSNAVLAGELTPASRLLPLWEGRRWTQEVYSPFASPKSPLELLEAEVTGQVRLDHNRTSSDVWVVEYRATERTGNTDEGRLRSRLYVNQLGWILKQESFIMGSSVALQRESEERSAELAKELLGLSPTDREPEPFEQADNRNTDQPAPTQESAVR